MIHKLWIWFWNYTTHSQLFERRTDLNFHFPANSQCCIFLPFLWSHSNYLLAMNLVYTLMCGCYLFQGHYYFFCHFLTFYIVYSFITSLAIMHVSTESHRQMSTLLMFKTKIDIYCWHFDTSFSISFFEFWMSCMLWITLKPRNIFSYLNIFGITK